LDDYLEKLLEGSFSPKSLFLSFRKNIESLGDALRRGKDPPTGIRFFTFYRIAIVSNPL
jgi:hypothetical protein